MTLFLDEETVAHLVTMDDALAAVAEAFAASGDGTAVNVPRVRAPLGNGVLRITAAVLSYRGYYGVKMSSTAVFGSTAGRVFNLFKDDGELCAVMQVFTLGSLRTGASSGVATDHLANKDAAVLGVIGSGRQARTQVAAIRSVRAIEEIRVFSPNPTRRAAFCDAVSDARVSAGGVDRAEEAVRGADIVVTATTATSPVMMGTWLSPGTHVNAVGANYEHRRELDSEAVARASVIVTDDRQQVRYEATDLAAPVREGLLDWERVRGLDELLAGTALGRRSPDEITLFKSLGVALGDVALAVRAYEAALAAGAGQRLPDLAGAGS